MLGAEGVITAVLGYLQAAMPAKLAELRTRYGATELQLPEIPRWIDYEPDDLAVDKPPVVAVLEQQSDTLAGPTRNLDDGSGGSTYRYRYAVTVIVYVRGRNRAETAALRRRYGLGLRELLLQRPGLGDPDPGWVVLVPETIVEAYSPLDTAQQEVFGATGIDLHYETQEWLAPLRPGPVAGVPDTTVGVGP